MAAAKKSSADRLPPAGDWRTTDQDEVLRRRLRARQERFRITNLNEAHRIFSNFEVLSASGRIYQVELRGLERGTSTCQCPDFASNRLGTCKHVEAVLLHLGRREKPAMVEARSKPYPRFDILPDGEGGNLCLRWNPTRAMPKALREWFGPDGNLSGGTPEDAVPALLRLADGRLPDLRVSQEVGPWLERRQRNRQSRELRREYELKVQAGDWPMHETKVALFPYQREGMLHLAFKERALLADEMGLGKTIQAIAASALLHRLGTVRRVLVITPASLKSEWDDQIARFTDLSRELLFGSHRTRSAWLRQHARTDDFPVFTVANYEQVAPAIEEYNSLLRPDVVILDEAQRIKNWNTRLARRIKQLRSRYAFVLTGTPIENRIDELRSLVDFLDPSILGSLFQFNRDFYDLDDRGRPKGYRNLDVLHQRVAPLLLRRRKADVETELPGRTDRTHFVQLTDRQRSTYSLHEQEVMKLVTAAERRPLTEREQERLQIELSMMRMICDTNYILDPEDRECPKLEEIARIVEDCVANDSKVIIFSEWTRMLELVRGVCEERDIDFAWHTGSVPQKRRRVDIDRFKCDPQCRVFLTSDSGATGLNLQAASVVVNCDLPWNPARLEQRIARAWRKNQTRPVTVVNLVARDTIEERMLATLATKRSVAESVLDLGGAVKSIPLRTGRKESMDRLRGLVQNPGSGTTGSAADSGPRSKPVVLRQVDPAAEFARLAAQRLGGALAHCEERLPLTGGVPVLLAVVEQVTPARRDQLERTLVASYENLGTDDSPAVKLEVIDRATHEAIERLIEAGLLQRTAKFTRPLPLDAGQDTPPPLTEEEQQRAKAHRDSARHALRRARVLGPAGFIDETRASLLEALHLIGKVLAVEQRLPEPETLEAVAVPPLARLWSDRLPLIEGYLSSPSPDWQALADCLEARSL